MLVSFIVYVNPGRNTPYSVSVQNSIDAISRSSGNFESYEKVFRYPEFTFCSPASNGPRKKQV